MPSPDATAVPSTEGLCFVARQAILDPYERVYGYELLFRSGWENFFSFPDLDRASRHTLDTSLLIGLETLCDGRRAFFNCTREVLLAGLGELLPPNLTVLEILEGVEHDQEVVQACVRLKRAGYQIALDDFVPGDKHDPLLEVADILKVDFRQASLKDCSQLSRKFSSRGMRLLAEKVETREEFLRARSMGYHYFQGYFFSRPKIVSTKEISATQMSCLRILQAVHEPELDFRQIEDLIKTEAALCYRLLRYLNSAAFFFERGITSIRHALSLLGQAEIRRWISLVAVVAVGQSKPREHTVGCLVRARFCELLASEAGGNLNEAFLLGLVSRMDVLLDLPLEEVLRRVPVSEPIKAALQGEQNHLRPVYELVQAYEASDWDGCSVLTKRLRLSEKSIASGYVQALHWAQQLCC